MSESDGDSVAGGGEGRRTAGRRGRQARGGEGTGKGRNSGSGIGEGVAAPLSLDAVRGRALALLTQREHSRAELNTKLGDWGASPEQISTILDELAGRHLQDDARFAEVFVRSRRQRGKGPTAIRQELRQRGVEAELVSTALDQAEVDWRAEAASVRARRFGPELPTDRKEQARQLRFLQYRGFNTAQAMAAIRQTGDDWDE